MARRWQLSLWVLAGLTAAVAGLWDSATVSAVADRVTERTETIDRSDRPDTGGVAASEPAFGELAFGDGHGSRWGAGGSNLLRPTTTTTTRPTTTTSTAAPLDEAANAASGDGLGVGDDDAPGSATTTPIGGEGDSSVSTDRSRFSTTTSTTLLTMPSGDPALTTAYREDFSGGALDGDQWSIADSAAGSVDSQGRGLFRPSSVAVLPDPAAAGGHVLAVTARMGTGADVGQVVSGAIRLVGHELVFGRYTIRARVDPDPDVVTAGVVVLRPAAAGAADSTKAADDEIRIVETGRNRSSRTPVESTLRWSGAAEVSSIEKAHRTDDGPVSAAAWHVYTLDWTADRVTVAVDGEPLDLTVEADHVPSGPMELEIRLDPLAPPAAPEEQPMLSGEVRLLIDWVRVEHHR